MDFIKNLFFHHQNVSDAEIIAEEEKVAQNFVTVNTVLVQRDLNIDTLLTSQSSDEISDIFKNTDHITESSLNSDLKDILEIIDDKNDKKINVSKCSSKNICIDFESGKPTPDKNLESDGLNLAIKFNEINKVSDKIDALEEPALNLDDFFDIFSSYDDVDRKNCNDIDKASNENENIPPENHKKEPLILPDNNFDVNSESEIFLDEFEGFFKCLGNNDPKKVDAVENTPSAVKGKTTENLENLTMINVEVPVEFNISLTPIDIEHDSMSQHTNTCTDELKLESMFINDFDFEADLEKTVIFKNGVIQTVVQPLPQIEKGVTDEKNTSYKLKDDNTSSICSVFSSKTNNLNPNNAISVSSTENRRPYENTHGDSDYCSGYNSSDFEFISEDEAQAGLMINKKITTKKTNTVHTLETSQNKYYVSGSSEDSTELINAPGPSNPRNRPNIFYNPGDISYRQNHRKPEEQEYWNLFQIYAISDIFFLETKSVSCMNVPMKQVDLDMTEDSNNYSDYEFRHEAKESSEKIQLMYPEENRKRF